MQNAKNHTSNPRFKVVSGFFAALALVLTGFFALPHDASRVAAAALPGSPKPAPAMQAEGAPAPQPTAPLALAPVAKRRVMKPVAKKPAAQPAVLAKPLAMRVVAMTPKAPVALPVARTLGAGHASFYGNEFAGRPTANGERFNPAALTAAHRTLPMGSKVRVTNLNNGRSVVVRINDRGPFVRHRLIDVSHGAAKQLGMVASGTAKVKLELLAS